MDEKKPNWIVWLWETIGKNGISMLLPQLIMRQGEANASAKRIEFLVVAQAEREAEEIRSGRKSVSEFPRKLEFRADASRADAGLDVGRMLFESATVELVCDTIRRECNVARAIAFAEERLESETQEVPIESIDADWLQNWRDLAGRVSSETVQHLWGSVLAGELKSPGKYSPRFLDFLKNLTHAEAKLIEEFASFVIEETIVWVSERPRYDRPPYYLCAEMQELGVLSGTETPRGLVFRQPPMSNPSFAILESHGKALTITRVDSKPLGDVQLSAYFLTNVGKQLLSLGQFQPDLEYLKWCGRSLKTKVRKIGLADCRHVDGGFELSNEIEI